MDDLVSLLSGFGNQRMEDVGVLPFIFIIIASLLCAFAFSSLYSFFFAKRATGSQVHRAFPLLAISITVIFITIQFSLPLSLGLLGALSIVRFRTPIKEPEEIGFIMLVVASSLACATFNITFTVILGVVAAIALYIMEIISPLSRGKVHGGMLIIRGPKDGQVVTVVEGLQNELYSVFRDGSLQSIAYEEDVCLTFVFHKTNRTDVNEITSKMIDSYPQFQFNLILNKSPIL